MPARTPEFHAGRRRRPQQEDIEDDDERNRRYRRVSQTHLNDRHPQLHVVAENAAHPGNHLSRGVLVKDAFSQLPPQHKDHDAGTEECDQHAPIHGRHLRQVTHHLKKHHGHQKLKNKLREPRRHHFVEHPHLYSPPAQKDEEKKRCTEFKMMEKELHSSCPRNTGRKLSDVND